MNEAGPDYRAAFEWATPHLDGHIAEVEIERHGQPLTIAFVDPADSASSVHDSILQLLDRLDACDATARGFLMRQPGWPYGQDAELWLVIVEPGHARLCYQQSSVNDEQVIGFAWGGEDWQLQGFDPRFRRL